MNVEQAQAVIAAALQKTRAMRVSWSPHQPTEKQKLFRQVRSREALFGGAAGGGKSDELLAEALEHVNIPGYSAILFRRTYPQLSGAGGLIPRAKEWLAGTEAEWREKTTTFTFPSGATIKFGHMQHEQNKYDYQGHEYQFIGWDELTQFTETQYRYLLSRLRRGEGSQVPLRMRAASNPGGIGHEWVKRRFVDEGTSGDRVYVPSRLEDNPHLDQEQYEEALKGLDSITYQQLREGRWIRDTTGLVYKFDYDRNTEEGLPDDVPDSSWRYILGVDLGASESKPTTAFVVVAFNRFHPNVYVIESEKAAAMIPSTIADRIRDFQAVYGGFSEITVDTGALGRGYKGEFEQRYGIPITDARKRDKLGYRKLINSDLEKGFLRLEADTNADLISELNELAWNDMGTDNMKGSDNHLSDALLYAWRSAKHFISKELQVKAERGTPEWHETEAQEMKKRRVISLQKERDRRRQPWWKRRRG